ncbi:MAG: Glu/Leu/Phe/Val dehydrogenase [Actinobacteria bacterium]|nr:Glu/Leu/Phe/Val dehydrogenase [Actinomycetota bacterium]
MSPLEAIAALGHEEILFRQDSSSGYRAIIALHSTALGPATGGTRLWPYSSTSDALVDALRLSRGMTYKNAIAGLALGGGKAVILAPPEPFDREQLFLAHGRAVQSLGGRFITAEDVGTTPADFMVAARETEWVAGFDGRGGDPSPWTARGVMAGLVAATEHRWGNPALEGRVVALQGCGNVGDALARQLSEAGAALVVTDRDAARAERLADEIGATVVAPEAIYDVEADIFSPCALGSILDDSTIARLRVDVIAGAANNQLAEDRHAEALSARDIVYAPDFVINAGGVISGSVALLNETQDDMVRRVDGIHDTTREVLDHAARERITTLRAAERRAEMALAHARKDDR